MSLQKQQLAWNPPRKCSDVAQPQQAMLQLFIAGREEVNLGVCHLKM
jgi:hypothetical protein